MPGCRWWQRWRHRRARQIDRDVMWPVVRGMAARAHPTDEEAAVVAALEGWAVFIQAQGQAHWRCPCAEEDDC